MFTHRAGLPNEAGLTVPIILLDMSSTLTNTARNFAKTEDTVPYRLKQLNINYLY